MLSKAVKHRRAVNRLKRTYRGRLAMKVLNISPGVLAGVGKRTARKRRALERALHAQVDLALVQAQERDARRIDVDVVYVWSLAAKYPPVNRVVIGNGLVINFQEENDHAEQGR